MRHLAMLLMSALALAGASTQADAQSKRVVRKAPLVKAAPPAPSGGTGFYVGAVGGYSWSRAHFSSGVAGTTTNVPTGLAGLTFGYNAQRGAFVYGIETDFSGAWNKGTNGAVAPCLGCQVGLTYFGTLRGRAGYAVGQALPYVTGGLAYAAVKAGLPGGPKDTDVRAGWTVGGGIEYALGGAWSVKSEYLYFEIDRTNCDPTACGPNTSIKVRGNMVRGGLNYRF